MYKSQSCVMSRPIYSIFFTEQGTIVLLLTPLYTVWEESECDYRPCV
jgi:hypothetical protein